MRWCSVGAFTWSVSAKNTTVDNITVPAILSRILHPIGCVRLCDAPDLIAAERSLTDKRSAAMSLYYSCAKASRNFCSCSSGRLVEMISKS
jgi:hypothetical protein